MTETEFLQRIAALANENRFAEAADLSGEAVGRFPADERLLHARAIVLRRAGQVDAAFAFLNAEIDRRPDVAWLHAQVGVLAHGFPRAIEAYRRAHALEPTSLDYRMGLVQALGRFGDQGDDLEEAYQILRPALPGASTWPERHLHVAFHVLKSVCAYDELDALGDPLVIGRKLAASGGHTALFMFLGYAGSDETRAELMELHRLAAAPMESAAKLKYHPGRDGEAVH